MNSKLLTNETTRRFAENDGHQPLDLSKLVMSKQVRDTLFSMLVDVSVRLSYSPARLWGDSPKPDDVGSWVVRLGHLDTTMLHKIHGQTIYHLFDAGVIETCFEHTTPKRVMFKVSKEALANINEIRRIVAHPQVKLVRWEPLNELAALYGVKVEYNRTFGLLKLVTLKGESFRPDEYVIENEKHEPVTKIADVTWPEWIKILEECAEILASKKA